MKKVLNIKKLSIRYNVLLVFLFLSLIINIGLVSAVGISPAEKLISYDELNIKPNEMFNVKYNIYNLEGRDLNVSIKTKGFLSNYTSLNETHLVIKKDEKSKELILLLDFNKLKNISCGNYNLDLLVSGLPLSNNHSNVGGVSIVKGFLNLRIPCNDKEVNAVINMFDYTNNNMLYITYENIGKLDINSINTKLLIYDCDNNELKSIVLNNISLTKNSQKILKSELVLSPGKYTVVINSTYDNYTKIFNNSFSIGNKSIYVDDIIINSYNSQILDLKLFLENEWNGNLKDISIISYVYNKNHSLIDIYRSSLFDMDRQDHTELNLYFDLSKYDRGRYFVESHVNLGNDYVFWFSFKKGFFGNLKLDYNGHNSIHNNFILFWILLIIIFLINMYFIKLHYDYKKRGKIKKKIRK